MPTMAGMMANLNDQLVPAQVEMVDSAAKAEASGAGGAATENSINHGLGMCFETLCCCCAGAGCTPNLATIQQGHVGIVTQYGRYVRKLEAGRHKFNLMSEKVLPIDMRVTTIDVPHQEMMTQDNLMVKVDAVCYYRVVDAYRAYFLVSQYHTAISQLIQVTLRTVIGEHALGEVLTERAKLSTRVKQLLEEGSQAWGIEVDNVEMKDIQIDDKMQRAMAAKTEATQEAEAKIIQARAQRDSAMILVEAAQKMASNEGAMKLQWFETLRIISTQGNNTTLIVPDSVDILKK